MAVCSDGAKVSRSMISCCHPTMYSCTCNSPFSRHEAIYPTLCYHNSRSPSLRVLPRSHHIPITPHSTRSDTHTISYGTADRNRTLEPPTLRSIYLHSTIPTRPSSHPGHGHIQPVLPVQCPEGHTFLPPTPMAQVRHNLRLV